MDSSDHGQDVGQNGIADARSAPAAPAEADRSDNLHPNLIALVRLLARQAARQALPEPQPLPPASPAPPDTANPTGA